MSLWSSIGFTGGGGMLGGGLVKGVQILWSDKKKIVAEYKQDRKLFMETVQRVERAYGEVAGGIKKIEEKLGIE